MCVCLFYVNFLPRTWTSSARSKAASYALTSKRETCSRRECASPPALSGHRSLASTPLHQSPTPQLLARSLANGSQIPIEERKRAEIAELNGKLSVPANAAVFNPAV